MNLGSLQLPTPTLRKSLIVLIAMINTAAAAWCEPLPNPGQIVRYLNPVHERSYLNQSQDRIIKKKSFKEAGPAGSQAIANKEIGLFARIDNASISSGAYLDRLLANGDVNGLSAILPWKSLEPIEGQYDFQTIDQLLSACHAHGKSLILRVSTCGLDDGTSAQRDIAPAHNSVEKHDEGRELGAVNNSDKYANSDTPAWVFASGAKSITYTGKDGKSHLMPIYWDTTYLAKWANFIGELGRKYDKNPDIHSIGITGGGMLGGTSVVPDFLLSKENFDKLEDELKTSFKMSPRQLVSHWRYVADLFPKAFPTARMNFDVDPPIPNRSGQDTLDEVVDYLIYRYGERVYLTRQNVTDGKHGFDQYRIMLKFKGDTLTGYQLDADVSDESLAKIVKYSLDDGASFAEIPASFFTENNHDKDALLHRWSVHLGYQLTAEDVELPSSIKAGEPLTASFKFANTGAATPKRPSRELDKDIPASYKIQLELRDKNGKAVVDSRHTPEIPTMSWSAGKPIEWQRTLKMPVLNPGIYSVWLSLIDDVGKRKLLLINGMKKGGSVPQVDLALGTIEITR
jgi:hypothetical protein